MHSRESDHFSLDGALEKANWAFLSAKSHVSFLVFHYAPVGWTEETADFTSSSADLPLRTRGSATVHFEGSII